MFFTNIVELGGVEVHIFSHATNILDFVAVACSLLVVFSLALSYKFLTSLLLTGNDAAPLKQLRLYYFILKVSASPELSSIFFFAKL